MKNLIKNSLVIVAVLTTLLSSAKESYSLRKANDEKTTLLKLENVKQGHQIFIKDNNGVVLYKEAIERSGSYVKGFDFTSLPNGKYFFEIEKDLKIEVIPFNIDSNVIKVNKELEATLFKPHVRTKESLVFLSKLTLDQTPLKVSVYYDNNGENYYELIHSESVKNAKIVEKVYALDKTKKGSYKIVTESKGRTFVNYFEL